LLNEQSIYPDVCISNDAEPFGRTIKLEIPVELSPARSVTIISPQNHSHATSPLVALPPFLLALILPPEYPLRAPPRITSLTCTHGWYPGSDLHAHLAEMWMHDSQGVLYAWVAFISGAEFLQSEDITIINSSPLTLLPLLESYNTHAQDTAFAETSFSCAICLSPHKGRHCVRLACSHIFCRSCLSDFWGSCITEGDIGRVGCPDPLCVKAGHEDVLGANLRFVRSVDERGMDRSTSARYK
jgi:E3 ubiquitin-protein ligase RNF14